MFYSATIKQARSFELFGNLIDTDHLLILEFLNAWSGLRSTEKIMLDGSVYFWVSYSVILSKNPLLKVSSPDTLAKKMKKMVSVGLIIPHPENQKLQRTYWTWGDAYEQYYFQTSEIPDTKNNWNSKHYASVFDNTVSNLCKDAGCEYSPINWGVMAGKEFSNLKRLLFDAISVDLKKKLERDPLPEELEKAFVAIIKRGWAYLCHVGKSNAPTQGFTPSIVYKVYNNLKSFNAVPSQSKARKQSDVSLNAKSYE